MGTSETIMDSQTHVLPFSPLDYKRGHGQYAYQIKSYAYKRGPSFSDAKDGAASRHAAYHLWHIADWFH